MSDAPGATTDGSSTSPDGNDTSGSTSAAGDEFTPITSQEELDARIGPRLQRERAKFADYDELKAAAARLAELEDSQKDDLTRATERVAALEAEVADVPGKVADALKAHLKAIHKISDEDAELFLTATDPDLLLRQAERLLGRAADARTGGNRVPREGTNTTSAPSDERQAVRQLFGASG